MEEHIEFKEKGIYIYLYEKEYEHVKKLVIDNYHRSDSRKNCLKTYLVVKMFSILNPYSKYVPISTEIFEDIVNTKYNDYVNFLTKEFIIHTKQNILWLDGTPKNLGNILCCVRKSDKSKEDKTLTCVSILKENYYGVGYNALKTKGGRFDFDYRFLLKKYEFINEIINTYKSNTKRATKINEVLKLDFGEMNYCNYISGIVHRVNKEISKYKNEEDLNTYGRYSFNTMLNDETKTLAFGNQKLLLTLVNSKLQEKFSNLSKFKLGKLISRRLKNSNVNSFYSVKYKLSSILNNFIWSINTKLFCGIEQYLELQLFRELNGNQKVNCLERAAFLTHFNNPLGYYSNLKVDISALKICIFVKYFSLISRINEIPKYHENDNKLYSTFANMPRILRKYVRYKGDFSFNKEEKLIEVSDVRCAHFTMLPVLFKKYNINISDEEMTRFKDLTQNKDLYSEVVKSSPMSRDDIKDVFQSFLSIKNERQYCYSENKEDRALVCEYFKTNFPEIYKAILRFHNDNETTIKNEMNCIESEIMNDICDKLRAENLHPFRVHDAIYLPESETPSFNIKDRVFEYINK